MKPACTLPMCWLVLLPLLSGCASQKQLVSFGDEYLRANQSAVDAVSAELKLLQRTRRIAAILWYITDPKPSIVTNIDRKRPLPSFINFVCAGADDFDVTNAALAYTTQYASAIRAITTVPDDSIAGYLEALTSLKREGKLLDPPHVKTNQFEVCRETVQRDLSLKGYPIVPPKPEAGVAEIASVQAFKDAISGIESLVKSALKLATEVEQRRALSVFFSKNRESYYRVLREDLGSAELSAAFERRRGIALVAPYYDFEYMLGLPQKTPPRDILAIASRIDASLAEYDRIRAQPNPSKLSEQFKKIDEKLLAYVSGKVSVAETRQFLSDIGKELSQLKVNYQATEKALKSIQDF